jgi:hypothetical protein
MAALEGQSDYAEPDRRAEWNLRYAQHPVRTEAAALARRLQGLVAAVGAVPKDDPFFRLLVYARRCTAKMAGALAGYTHPTMLAPAITSLRAALRAASACLAKVDPCVQTGRFGPWQAEGLTRELLAIRTHLEKLLEQFRLHLADGAGIDEA